jgi:hypothetical protein
MNSIFDTSEEPLSKEELIEVREYANERIRLWRKRSLYSGIALFLSCASVGPFLRGHSLHAHWDSFGKYLVLLSMGLLVVFVYCTGLAWSAWMALRDVTKA